MKKTSLIIALLLGMTACGPSDEAEKTASADTNAVPAASALVEEAGEAVDAVVDKTEEMVEEANDMAEEGMEEVQDNMDEAKEEVNGMIEGDIDTDAEKEALLDDAASKADQIQDDAAPEMDEMPAVSEEEVQE